MPETDALKEKRKSLPYRVLFTLALIFALLFAAQSVMLPETISAQAASSGYTGWKTKSGSKYYYKNGKKVTGWKKISGKYYYFNSKGKLQTNKIVGSKKKGYYYVDSSGVRVTDKTIKKAVSFVTKNSKSSQTRKQRLRACYDALCKKYSYKHFYGQKVPSASDLPKYARYVFNNKKGDCYRFASAMAYIARVLGYSSRVAYGGVSTNMYKTTSLTAHGWCEVKISGKWRILDVTMQMPRSIDLFLRTRSSYPSGLQLKCNGTYSMKVKNGKVSWK